MANIEQLVKYEKVREVYAFMNKTSKQRKEIIHHFSKKWTDDGYFKAEISELSKARHIDNYIRRVKKAYLNFDEEAEGERGRILARLDDLYTNCLSEKDYKGALAVLKEIAEITGNKVQKLDHTSKGDKITITRIPVTSKK